MLVLHNGGALQLAVHTGVDVWLYGGGGWRLKEGDWWLANTDLPSGILYPRTKISFCFAGWFQWCYKCCSTWNHFFRVGSRYKSSLKPSLDLMASTYQFPSRLVCPVLCCGVFVKEEVTQHLSQSKFRWGLCRRASG